MILMIIQLQQIITITVIKMVMQTTMNTRD